MANINSYLLFNGNCREAMTFYKNCLGGELAFQTVGESPLSQQMPQQMLDYILHSTLQNGEVILMASDMAGEKGVEKGNNISLLFNCKMENEIYELYQKLSDGGRQDHPVQRTHWGALFGGLTDKYGNNWLLNYEAN